MFTEPYSSVLCNYCPVLESVRSNQFPSSIAICNMDPLVLSIRLGAMKDAVKEGKQMVLRATAAKSREEMDFLHEGLQEIFASRLHRMDRAARPVMETQGSTARGCTGLFAPCMLLPSHLCRSIICPYVKRDTINFF